MAWDLTPGFSLKNVLRTQANKVIDPNIDLIPGVGLPGGNTGGQSYGSAQQRTNTGNPAWMAATGGGTRPATANPGALTQGQAGDGTGNDNAADLAMLDSQERQLRDFLARAQGKFGQGVSDIETGYQRNVGEATGQRDRAMRDYGIKEEDNNRNQTGQLEQVNQKANSLANMVRRTIGRASGSGSSAYSLTGPSAVAEEVSDDREGVQETFGQNFRNLDLAKKDTDTDYQKLLGSYDEQKRNSLRDFEGNYNDQIISANGRLGDIASNRTALRGGNLQSIMAARQPYDAEVTSRNNTIDSLFEKYRNPYQKRDVAVAAPSLADYTRQRTGISAGQVAASDPSNPLRRPLMQDEDEDRLV